MGKEKGLRLRELRKESKLKPKQFAEQFNVSESTQISYENGARDFPLDYAVKVCDKYGVTLDWLFGRSEIRKTTDIMVSIILALDKIMKTGYRTKKFDDYKYHEPVLWVDKTFAKYLQEIRELQSLRILKENDSFSQLRLDIQKKYEGYLKGLFGEDNYETADIRFDDIEAVEITEFLTDAYCED